MTGSYCSEVALDSLVSSPICLPIQLCQAWQLLIAASLALHVAQGRTCCSVHLNTVGSNSIHVPHTHQAQIQDFWGQSSFKLRIRKQTQKHECTGKERALSTWPCWFPEVGRPLPPTGCQQRAVGCFQQAYPLVTEPQVHCRWEQWLLVDSEAFDAFNI